MREPNRVGPTIIREGNLRGQTSFDVCFFAVMSIWNMLFLISLALKKLKSKRFTKAFCKGTDPTVWASLLPPIAKTPGVCCLDLWWSEM